MNLINEIPLFYQSHVVNDNGGFPQSFPFYLYFDQDLKMFRQKNTPELKNILLKVYKNGSLAEGSISSESGMVYVDKVTSYILKELDLMISPNVLEVGHGSGNILRALYKSGVKNLTGIEPGGHHLVDGLDGIRLIRDFFPSDLISERYDLIYSLLVLEHIEEPVTYLRELIERVNDNGKIIFAVPNCEPYLKEGDLSIFIHEHYSYFTRESIVELVGRTDFKIEDITIVEGAFIATISKNAMTDTNSYDVFTESEFEEKASKHIESIGTFIDKYQRKEVAIYAPIRAINLLFLTGKEDVRLVDDNSELYGKFLPSLVARIESFEEMTITPPKCIIIFSRTFGERIKQRCIINTRLKNTRIVTLKDLGN